MKGVILAGGTGTRLYPLTRLMNKHLLPVGKYPMVCYGIDRLRRGDNRYSPGDQQTVCRTVHRLLGQRRGIRSIPDLQNPGSCRRHRGSARAGRRIYFAGERFVVLLGDNLFMDDLKPYVESYLQQPQGSAKVLLKPVDDARRYGVPVFDSGDSSLIAYIEEKPERPKTKFCVTGIYMYDEAVFDIIRRVSPSNRGSWKLPT